MLPLWCTPDCCCTTAQTFNNCVQTFVDGFKLPFVDVDGKPPQ